MGLSREYLTKGFSEKLVDAYYKYIVDVAVILGANRERATKEIGESIEFEMKLANVSVCMSLCSCYTQIKKRQRCCAYFLVNEYLVTLEIETNWICIDNCWLLNMQFRAYIYIYTRTQMSYETLLSV